MRGVAFLQDLALAMIVAGIGAGAGSPVQAAESLSLCVVSNRAHPTNWFRRVFFLKRK
jgi:hypothetical protein